MDFRNLQEEFERDRKKRRLNFIMWTVIILFVGLYSLNHIFWCFLLWITLLLTLIVIFGIFAAFTKKLKADSFVDKLMVLFMRLCGVGFSCLCFALFISVGAFNYYLDIPNYINQNVNVVEGKAEIDTNTARGFIFQTVTINGIKFLNPYYINPRNFNGEILEIHYLPKSKYVIGIWYYE